MLGHHHRLERAGPIARQTHINRSDPGLHGDDRVVGRLGQDAHVCGAWRYLLATETDIQNANSRWLDLVKGAK